LLPLGTALTLVLTPELVLISEAIAVAIAFSLPLAVTPV